MKATITKILVNDYKGKKSYVFTMSDNTAGYVDAKDAEKFRENDEVDYNVEVKQNKQGKDYNLLTVSKIAPPQTGTPPPSFVPPVSQSPQPTQSAKDKLRAEVPFKAGEKIVDLVLNGKVQWEQFGKYYRELCDYFYAEIDKLPIGKG